MLFCCLLCWHIILDLNSQTYVSFWKRGVWSKYWCFRSYWGTWFLNNGWMLRSEAGYQCSIGNLSWLTQRVRFLVGVASIWVLRFGRLLWVNKFQGLQLGFLKFGNHSLNASGKSKLLHAITNTFKPLWNVSKLLPTMAKDLGSIPGTHHECRQVPLSFTFLPCHFPMLSRPTVGSLMCGTPLTNGSAVTVTGGPWILLELWDLSIKQILAKQEVMI